MSDIAWRCLRSTLIYCRVRGHQFKSNGPGEAKHNKPAFTKLVASNEDSARNDLPSNDVDAGQLEKQGFAEKTG